MRFALSVKRSGLLAFLCLAAVRLPVGAQEALPKEEAPYVFRAWKTEDGLPNNSVTAIAQTPDGYLWLGTYNGLARFDGVNCHALGLRDGLRSLQISALLLDSRRTLWIGTVGGGLSRLERGAITTLTSSNGLASDSVNSLLEAKDGVIWIGTPSGLSQWKDGALVAHPAPELAGENIGPLASDHSGAVWVATAANKLFRSQSGRFELISVPRALTLVHSLLVDEQNRLWVGAATGTIFRRDNEGQSWTVFGQKEGLPRALINTLAVSPDGAIWAGTLDAGICYLREGKFASLRESNGLSSDGVYSLFVDRDHFVWVGTRAGGLCRLTPRRMYNLRVLEDGEERLPNSLAETTDGKLWVSTPGRGLFQWDGVEFKQFLREPPISGHRFVRAVLAGRDGSLWWGAGPALFQWKDGRLTGEYNTDNEPWLQGDRVSALCEDVQDGLWVGTFNGQLRHLQNGTFASVGKLAGQPVSAIAQQTNGTLWVGTFGSGLVRIQDGTQTNLVASHDGLGSSLIRTLFLDKDEVLWIGTASGGLGRYKSGKLDFFGLQQGLVDTHITQIEEDDDGNLWLGCDRGIMRVNKAGLERIASGLSPSLHPQLFGRREGMLSEQCAIAFHAALRSRTGRLYFSTVRSIAIADPRQHAALSSPPSVMLENVLVDGKDQTVKFGRATALPLDQQVPGGVATLVPKIGPGSKVIQFRFTGLSFDAPDRIQFRYKLSPVDSSWIDAGKDREATYAHLGPGNYVFRVIASNAQGLWNDTGISISFVVLPYLWQRGWFLVLMYVAGLIVIAGTIFLVARRRYQHRLKILEMERAMENERARIARDLHDEVGSSLTRISMLSEQVHSRLSDPEQLKARAHKLADFAVRTTRAFEEIVWAVNPRNDSLPSLLEYLTHIAQEMFEDSGITCRFHFPDDPPKISLPPETRHSFFLTIKEALTNALKHSGATQITLQVDLNSESLQVMVQDNGRGFDPAAPTSDGAEHNGLHNMRQRVEHLGGQFTIETRPGHGTTVCVRLPRRMLAVPKSDQAANVSRNH
jgi:signal transduction histidine kinase/ligand-binding sensor domain-containing protein